MPGAWAYDILLRSKALQCSTNTNRLKTKELDKLPETLSPRYLVYLKYVNNM